MPLLIRTAVALAVLLAPVRAPRAAAPAPAAPVAEPAPDEDTAAVEVPADDEAAVAQAKAFWAKGQWGQVRATLEPLADDSTRLGDPALLERAMLILADATISDRRNDFSARRKLATPYLSRLMDADSTWRMSPDIYSPELYDLFVELQEERSRKIDANCQADLMACRSDRATDAEAHRDLQERYDALLKDHAEQDVEVRTRVARSRFLAAIPFGVGHFYNGSLGGPRARTDRALGATFLSAEVAFGGVGLGLILYRLIGDGCRRTKAFQRGSLLCVVEDDARKPAILKRRQAEEVLGWFFWGTMVLDVVLAQVRFRKFEEVSVNRVKRRDLESGAVDEQTPEHRPRRPRPRAKVRPTGALVPHGAGLGVSVNF
jgi:hypothetical protein